MSSADLPALLQAFFVERMIQERSSSANTIAAYRDSFRLLLGFAADRLEKAPSDLAVEDVTAPFVTEFLAHLETARANSVRTRNARLAAIHSFFRYVALKEPAYALLCQRVLAIPNKKHERTVVEFLTREESETLIAVPDRTTWIGRRDRTLMLVALQTGLRVSELIGLRCRDVVLGAGAHVRCHGKGRKERSTPLRKEAASMLKAWLRERRGLAEDPLFPSVRGSRLSRDSVERLVAKHSKAARSRCPSLKRKAVTPHVLRHTAAMDLLQSGVDLSVIALWLGHESVASTQIYLHADLRIKERALARTTPLEAKPTRYRPDDALLAFLEAL